MSQMVKNLPTMQKIWVQSLGWEDPLEKGMATHSSILAWRIPWTEEPGGLRPMGSQRVGHDRATDTVVCQALCHIVTRPSGVSRTSFTACSPCSEGPQWV